MCPDFLSLQSNISLILHAVGEYELSLRFLEHALGLNIKYYGDKSLKVAVSYHLVARTQSCMGDFRSALNSEKETYAIYKQQVSVVNRGDSSSMDYRITSTVCPCFSWARLTRRRKSRPNACAI